MPGLRAQSPLDLHCPFLYSTVYQRIPPSRYMSLARPYSGHISSTHCIR